MILADKTRAKKYVGALLIKNNNNQMTRKKTFFFIKNYFYFKFNTYLFSLILSYNIFDNKQLIFKLILII